MPPEPDVATLAPPAPRAFQPTQRIVGREIHGARTVVDLECGHHADVPAAEGAMPSARCSRCEPIEVPRG